jgi:RNA polymerase sigma-70 factor (ECF subfamily)
LVQRTDEDLLLALRRGETDCLGILVSRWEQPLYRFVYRLLERHEDAKDVCQETFLRILRKADHFKSGARFSTWMYQIALNLCRDQLRRQRRWSLIVRPARDDRDEASAEDPASADDPTAALDADRRKRAVTRALDDLPPEQREVLILKEYEGMKFREIAAILSCPESTVKSRMYYGLSSLRSALERQGVRSLD